MRRRKGFSLVEVIAVIILIAILTLIATLGISKNIKRGNREAVTSDLQVYATGFSDAYYDLGSPSFNFNSDLNGDGSINDADVAVCDVQFLDYLKVISQEYLSVTFDETTLTHTTNGYSIEISTPLDVYERRYKCWFITNDSIMKYVMMVSGGEDGRIDTTGYNTQNYGDDIVLFVRPKSD